MRDLKSNCWYHLLMAIYRTKNEGRKSLMLLNGQKTGMGKILSVTTTDFFLLSFYTIFIYGLVNQLHIFKEKKEKKILKQVEYESTRRVKICFV